MKKVNMKDTSRNATFVRMKLQAIHDVGLSHASCSAVVEDFRDSRYTLVNF